MKIYEEKRKGRLEENKNKESNEAEEVHKSTTIFHGVTTDYGVNKGFVEHPSYLR
jgi:hypothetical protein